MNILSEQKLTLTEAARQVGVNSSTVWRWALKGVRGVKLETFSIGVKRFTTKESLTRFSERCTAAAAGEKIPCRTARQRQRDIDRAERELKNAGV